MTKKKKKDNTLDEILSSTKGLNEIGAEQAKTLSKRKAEAYQQSAASLWGVPASSPEKEEISIPEKSENVEKDNDTMASNTTIVQKTIVREDTPASKTQVSIAQATKTIVSDADVTSNAQVSDAIVVRDAQVFNAYVDSSNLTELCEIAGYTAMNMVPFILRQDKSLGLPQKLLLIHFLHRSYDQVSHIVSDSSSNIVKSTGLALKTVSNNLKALNDNGWIDYIPSKSPKGESKISLERTYERFIQEEELVARACDIIKTTYVPNAIASLTKVTHGTVLYVSKDINTYIPKEQNKENKEIQNSEVSSKHSVYSSTFDKTKSILLFAISKGFELKRISPKVFSNILDTFENNGKVKRTEHVEKELHEFIHAIKYTTNKAQKKNYWNFMLKSKIDNWHNVLTMEENVAACEEYDLAVKLCSEPDLVSVYGIEEVKNALRTFPDASKVGADGITPKNIDKVRSELKSHFVKTQTDITQYLEASGITKLSYSRELGK